MSLNERQKKIIEDLRAYEEVGVDKLAIRFAVTTQTVRRDIGELCDRGLARRIHGGARRLETTSSIGYEERRLFNIEGKEKIGRIAANLVPHDCSVILNIGTTTEQVARALTNHSGLIVISNNINVIQILRDAKLRDLVIVGGGVRRSDGAIVGNDAVEFISKYKVAYAVIGASSIDEDGSILDFDSREVAVSRTILKNARTRILVADQSKFERSAPVRICNLSELDYVILDGEPPADFLSVAASCGARVVTEETFNA